MQQHGAGAEKLRGNVDVTANNRLLVFAKYPWAGKVKTRLVPPLTYEEAATLFRSFLLDSVGQYMALVGETTPILYLADEEDGPEMERLLATEISEEVEIQFQRGCGLGERLANAYHDAFIGGAGAVCAIGTDHPTLPLRYISQAFHAMPDNDIAIGPASDGGYYLLCMRYFIPELFQELPFSTGVLYKQTVERARVMNLRVVELPEWYDVDDVGTLGRLWNELDIMSPDSLTPGTLRHIVAARPEIWNAIQNRLNIHQQGGKEK